jgi:membrane protein implicated in regulation of membrane protease activity
VLPGIATIAAVIALYAFGIISGFAVFLVLGVGAFLGLRRYSQRQARRPSARRRTANWRAQ